MNLGNNLDDSLIKELASKTKASEDLRKSIVWSKGSIVGYIWDVVRNLITLFVVVAIYDSTHGSFERITASLLILIYLTVISYGATLAMGNARSILVTYSQTLEIRRKSGQIENEDEELELKKANFILEKTMYKFYLNSVFSGLMYFIVVMKLLYSL